MEFDFEFDDLKGVTKDYFIPYLCRMLPADYILDVGCGLGQFLELCQRYNIRAIGLEGSKRALDECKRRGVNVVEGDLEQPLPFRDNTFDTIFCNQVIEHIHFDKQDLLFKECYRVLKPGGKAFFYSPCKYNPAEISKKGHIACITPSILKNKLMKAGFDEIDLRLNYPRKIKGVPLVMLHVLFILSKTKRFPIKLGDSKLIDFLSASAHAVAYKGDAK